MQVPILLKTQCQFAPLGSSMKIWEKKKNPRRTVNIFIVRNWIWVVILILFTRHYYLESRSVVSSWPEVPWMVSCHCSIHISWYFAEGYYLYKPSAAWTLELYVLYIYWMFSISEQFFKPMLILFSSYTVKRINPWKYKQETQECVFFLPLRDNFKMKKRSEWLCSSYSLAHF